MRYAQPCAACQRQLAARSRFAENGFTPYLGNDFGCTRCPSYRVRRDRIPRTVDDDDLDGVLSPTDRATKPCFRRHRIDSELAICVEDPQLVYESAKGVGYAFAIREGLDKPRLLIQTTLEIKQYINSLRSETVDTPDGLLPPQLDQLEKIVRNHAVDALIISIAGNDAGFTGVIRDLVEHDSHHFADDVADIRQRVADRMPRIREDFERLARRVQGFANSSAKCPHLHLPRSLQQSHRRPAPARHPRERRRF